nr:hypothetical protein Iba_chr05aCG8340 [Ipomoea batatas]
MRSPYVSSLISPGLLGTYGTKEWPHPRRDIKQTTDRVPRMVEIRNKQWHLDETGRNLDTVPRNRVGRPNGIFVLDEIRVDFPDPSRGKRSRRKARATEFITGDSRRQVRNFPSCPTTLDNDKTVAMVLPHALYQMEKIEEF